MNDTFLITAAIIVLIADIAATLRLIRPTSTGRRRLRTIIIVASLLAAALIIVVGAAMRSGTPSAS